MRCEPCYHPPRRVLGLDRSVFVAQLGDIQAVKRDAAGETQHPAVVWSRRAGQLRVLRAAVLEAMPTWISRLYGYR